MELLRLINLKVSSVITNQTAKFVLCIECASIVCGTDVDHQQAMKLSTLKPADYNRQKDLIEKQLKLGKTLTMDAICAQLAINERLKADAHQLFNEYLAKNPYFDDMEKGPIMAMAIYQSLKLRKEKLTAAKGKLMKLSKMQPKQWKQSEEDWDAWIDKCKPLTAAAAVDRQKARNRNESQGMFQFIHTSTKRNPNQK